MEERVCGGASLLQNEFVGERVWENGFVGERVYRRNSLEENKFAGKRDGWASLLECEFAGEEF